MSSHPSDQVLGELARGRASDAELTRHVGRCKACRELVAFLRVASSQAFPAGDCPVAEELVLLAAQSTKTRAASPLQPHLTACLDCAVELEGLIRIDTSTTKPPAALDAARRPTLAELLRALVGFEMPPQLSLATRSAAAETQTSACEAGFKAYREGRYRQAARQLAKAEREGDRTPALRFYLGVSLLRLGQDSAAARMLEEAVQEQPRRQEAHWYRAQALLACGRGAEALAALDRVVALKGGYRDRAETLRCRLEEAMGVR